MLLRAAPGVCVARAVRAPVAVEDGARDAGAVVPAAGAGRSSGTANCGNVATGVFSAGMDTGTGVALAAARIDCPIAPTYGTMRASMLITANQKRW